MSTLWQDLYLVKLEESTQTRKLLPMSNAFLSHSCRCPFIHSGLPWGMIALSTGTGWFLGGKFHSQRVRKTLQAKHKQEQKALYQQYYQDVYTLQQQNADLVAAIEQMGVKIR
jgi:hypothetical protein